MDSNDTNPFRYGGEYFDSETGLYYLRARYYDPKIGRFTTEDSYWGKDADPLSLNLYTYCHNNPIIYVDPSGNFPSLSELLHRSDKFVNDKLESLSSFVREKTDYKNFSVDTADIGGFFLQMDVDNDGVYHASFDCWQQYFGYNDSYDLAFDLGSSMDKAKFQFEYKGQDLIFWAWKGDYINLGAGAELGIYRRLEIMGFLTPHWLVDQSLALPMSLTLKDNNENTIIDYNPKENQWWITGFNPKFKDV
ncbi:RHS repeat-associated core domain-containing protein [Oceanirhabdus sp. W0125-5]|uniref:RHS repeat-associated core domain-containing protein n=1 Tax=Oceanirhabdus sp. W0125-5 TaxID=2999116 RepID=UPI003FA579C2